MYLADYFMVSYLHYIQAMQLKLVLSIDYIFVTDRPNYYQKDF